MKKLLKFAMGVFAFALAAFLLQGCSSGNSNLKMAEKPKDLISYNDYNFDNAYVGIMSSSDEVLRTRLSLRQNDSSNMERQVEVDFSKIPSQTEFTLFLYHYNQADGNWTGAIYNLPPVQTPTSFRFEMDVDSKKPMAVINNQKFLPWYYSDAIDMHRCLENVSSCSFNWILHLVKENGGHKHDLDPGRLEFTTQGNPLFNKAVIKVITKRGQSTGVLNEKNNLTLSNPGDLKDGIIKLTYDAGKKTKEFKVYCTGTNKTKLRIDLSVSGCPNYPSNTIKLYYIDELTFLLPKGTNITENPKEWGGCLDQVEGRTQY